MSIKLRGPSFVQGSLVYLLSNVLNAAIPFALLPILTRYLEPSEYGQIAMFQAVVGALGAVVGLNVAGAAARKYYDEQVNSRDLSSFLGACMQILLASGAVIFLFIFAFSGRLADWLGLHASWICLGVVVSMGAFVVRLRLLQWQVRKDATHYGILQVSQSLVNMSLSIFLVVVLLQGVEGRIVALTLTSITFALISIIFLKKDKLLNLFSYTPGYLKEALKHGVPLIPHVGGIFLLATVDRFIINSELGLDDTGIYMVALQIAGGMALVFDALNKAFVPWLFERLKRKDPKEIHQIVRFTYSWFVVIIFGATVFVVFAPWLVELVAGPDYRAAGDVIGWLILGQAFGGMYLMVTNYLIFAKRTGALSTVTVTAGVLNVLLLLFSVRLFGLHGAAVTFCIAMAVRFLLTWWVANKHYPMPWFRPGLRD